MDSDSVRPRQLTTVDSDSSSDSTPVSPDFDGLSREFSRRVLSIRNNTDEHSKRDSDPATTHSYSCGHVIPFKCFGDEIFTRYECRRCSWRKVFNVMRETRQAQASRYDSLASQIEDIRFIREEHELYQYTMNPMLIPDAIWPMWENILSPILTKISWCLERKRQQLLDQIMNMTDGGADTITNFMQDWVNRWGEVTRMEMDSWNEWLREAAAEDEAEEKRNS